MTHVHANTARIAGLAIALLAVAATLALVIAFASTRAADRGACALNQGSGRVECLGVPLLVAGRSPLGDAAPSGGSDRQSDAGTQDDPVGWRMH